MSLNMQTQNLCEETVDTRDLHIELRLRIQGTQVEIEMTRILVETTWCEFKTQLAEVQAPAERESCGRTGTGTDTLQSPILF
jgi:hypothetical protein